VPGQGPGAGGRTVCISPARPAEERQGAWAPAAKGKTRAACMRACLMLDAIGEGREGVPLATSRAASGSAPPLPLAFVLMGSTQAAKHPFPQPCPAPNCLRRCCSGRPPAARSRTSRLCSRAASGWPSTRCTQRRLARASRSS